jgi:hypothetical protein
MNLEKSELLNTIRTINGVGMTLKHRNMRDVVFKVRYGDETHAFDTVDPFIKLDGYWINVAMMKPMLICGDSIKIKSSDWEHWLEVEDPMNKYV